MKKFCIILIALLLVSGAMTQTQQPCSTCLPGGITFTNQAQIDNFQANYPGCTEIEGEVTIQGQDITNFIGLNVLTSIGGNLYIGNSLYGGNPSLTSLTGLENLASISGGLTIYENYALNSLAGLDGLLSVGSLHILNNSLNSLVGLENLTTINQSFIIDNNYALVSISGLGNLTSVGCFFKIEDNVALVSISGLGNLTSVGDNFEIVRNNALTNLTGLVNLNSIGGSLTIWGNEALASLTGLESLTSIGGNFYISSDVLTSMTGLESLSSIGGDLSIVNNNDLTTLSGMESLISIGDYLRINHNYSLIDLDGLESLTSLGGIEMYGNSDLTSISGLNNLTSIGGDLEIRTNGSLSTCDAEWLCNHLQNPSGIVNIYGNADGCNSVVELTNNCGGSFPCLPYGNYYFFTQSDIDHFPSAFPNCTELEGDVNVNGYDNISNLFGLIEVTSIEGQLNILDNNILTDLAGLDNLASLGGWLSIYWNDSLTTLEGLHSLNTAGGLVIGNDFGGGNPLLTSLSGLDNIDANSIEYLNISANASLSSCAIQSVCDYLATPNASVIIANNAPGCNSEEEVEEACETLWIESAVGSRQSGISCSPNPTGGICDLQFTVYNLQSVELKIYNLHGREVAVLMNGRKSGDQVVRWDATGLPAGIYFARLQAGNEATTMKVIKVE